MQTIDAPPRSVTAPLTARQEIVHADAVGYFFLTLLGKRVAKRDAIRIVTNHGVVFPIADPYPPRPTDVDRYFAIARQSDQAIIQHNGLLPTHPPVGCTDGIVLTDSSDRAKDLATAYAQTTPNRQAPLLLYAVSLPATHRPPISNDSHYGIKTSVLETEFGVPPRFVRSRGYALTM